MLGHLIRKEILDHLLSLRFMILSAIGALMIWLSLFSGYAYYQARLNDYRKAKASAEDRIREMVVAENLTEFVSIGHQEHKPPVLLSIFVRGLEPVLGRSVPIRTVGVQRLNRSPVEVAPILGIFPPLDLDLVVRVILSLFVLLFTYDAVSGEKESGPLRLMASFPVPKDRLLAGKLLGALIPTLAAFGLPLALGIGVMLLMPDISLAGSDLERLGMIMGAFVLYLAAFTCVGLLASCLTTRASTSFVVLLAFWVAAVVVLPRISLIVSEGIRPAPSVYELETEKQAVQKSNGDIWRALRRTWQQEYFKTKGQDFWKTPEGQEAYQLYYSETRRNALWAATRTAHDRLEETFQNRYNARLDLAVTLARCSPAFALSNATVRLAGTGLERQRRFFDAYRVYFKQFQIWLDTTDERDELKKINPAKYGRFKWDVSDMPRLNYQETAPEAEVRATLMDLGILALWGLLFFSGAYVAMLRYDLR